MVTSWPKDFPGLGTSAERMARSITAVTGGKIRVKVFPAGELVKSFEVFDAVSSGVAEMYHSAESYWEPKSPAFNFFCAMPFGFTADEMAAWLQFGGGQALWDELSATFNIKCLMSTSSGAQMGGWFNKEVSAPESYKGLRYRMPGPGAEVLRRLGAVVVTLPVGEIVPALKSALSTPANGSVPGSIWSSACTSVKYYYYPGFHGPARCFRPESTRVFGIRSARRAWPDFDCRRRQYTTSLAEFNANNAKGLEALGQDKSIEIRRFDDALVRALVRRARRVNGDREKDQLSRRIDSYAAFGRGRRWSDVAGELSSTPATDVRRQG